MPKYIQTESDLIAGDDPTLKQLVVEARAKIMWGERIQDVEKWLVIRGVGPEQIRVIIDSSSKERCIAIRRLGRRDVGLGIVPLAIGWAPFFQMLANPEVPISGSRWLGVALLLIVFGSWMVGRGILRIIQG